LTDHIEETEQLKKTFRRMDPTINYHVIIAHVIQKYKGDVNKKPRYELIEECRASGATNLNDRAFRDISSDLVVNYKVPILTSPGGGYYWYDPEHDEDRTSCYKRERRRGIKILVRTRAANKNCLAAKAKWHNMKQQELFQNFAKVG